ncbi:MAG: hypothetical protein JNL21_22300 [Myxococcales bacterium]|nr:hypothetical protein [Myxococcales bacterium]
MRRAKGGVPGFENDGVVAFVGDMSNIRNIVLAMEQAGDFTVDLFAQLP